MLNLITVAFGIIFALICRNYALARGRNPYAWTIVGFLFGFLGLIILFVLPNKKKRSLVQQQIDALPPLTVTNSPIPPATYRPWYYLDQQNLQQGPMSFQTLKNAWKEGKLNSTTYVWNEDLHEWKALGEVVDLSTS
jgi:hypothetical protein